MSKMKFGLNTSMKKTKPPTIKPKAFGQNDDDEDDKLVGKETKDSHKARINKQLAGYSSASTKKIEEEHKKALEEDPNIFDYDAVYDNLKTAEKMQQDKMKSKENKKARYVEGLIEMAELRKRDRLRADEKKVEREREEEGDLYGDKEAFVTSSYKEQKEELRRLEEEEKKKEAQEAKKKTFNGFYRQLLDEKEAVHAAIVEASIKGVTAQPEPSVGEGEDEEDTELAQQALQEGKDVMLNDDNIIVDKRQLLGAGLNVAKKPKFGTFMSLSDSDPRVQQRQQEYEDYKRKKLAESAAKRSGRGSEPERERMSREVERQMLERKQQEEEEEKKKEEEFKQKLQKRTSEDTVMSAKERYLARKKQKAGQS
ncbi:hypothetical protein INT43_007952 [Umbelopsis isabellina]|uniref:Nuclear speckle splicing regulatory protein 1 N-terminal domain-containing protein n=1 Tax=Mortierella isabellina TaxID=91625 RepID=A0A8H7PP14_MORIS|nr:hypothetical protein INT43_007952 [Umbelopsis isabellina]